MLLGAGLDLRPERLGDLDLEIVEIVEIDRVDVLVDKRARATAAGLGSPRAVRYLPADLATEPIDGLLSRALDGERRRTVIAWCGVTQYLPEAAVLATLRAIAALPQATGLVFTTFLPDARVPEDLRSGGRQIADLAATSGEPFLTRLTPESTGSIRV